MAEKIVRRLGARLEEAVREGAVDADKIAGGLASVLSQDGSAQALLDSQLDPQRLTDAWLATHPDRWSDFNADERALYESDLAEAARYLVQTAAELPTFKSRFAARMVQQLESLADDLDVVLARVDDIKRLVENKDLGDDETRFETDYRLAVSRWFDFMELLGADIPREARRHPLSVAYVSLSLMDASDAPEEEENLSVPRPFEQLLDELSGGRLLVRGEAGSGKSTLFRWAALQAAGPTVESAPAVSAPWRSRIPFLIRLRDYPEGELPGVADLPGNVAKQAGAPPADWVRRLLDDGKALLMFDGVDEVPIQRREQVRQEIDQIITAYPRNFYLVSTRPAAVPAGWLAGAEFSEAVIRPMSAVDRQQFIQEWHAAVYEQLKRDKQLTDEEDFTAMVGRLLRNLAENPPLALLATNPPLCGMICALNRQRRENLPRTQVELCEDLCRMLLERREIERELDLTRLSPAYGQLTYEQKRAVVQELAHYMVVNGQSSVAVTEADHCFSEALRRFPGLMPNNVKDIRLGFVERSGLLREPLPGRIDFVHNTLKEYLAGDRFAHLGHTGPLVEHALDPAWQPTILFAASSRVVGFADALTQRLLDDVSMGRRVAQLLGFPPAVEQKARRVFAARCGHAALHLSETIQQRIEDVLSNASRPESIAESAAFATLGDFIVPRLAYDDRLPARTTAACIRTLAMIGTKAARQLLSGYIADQRPTVRAELAEAFVAFVNSIKMQFVSVPAGEFFMGSEEVGDARPVRSVQITRSFLLGATPVTQDQYQRVMGDNPSNFKGDPARPVENVDWTDAVRFCIRLSEMEQCEPYYQRAQQIHRPCRGVSGVIGRMSPLGDTAMQCGGYLVFLCFAFEVCVFFDLFFHRRDEAPARARLPLHPDAG